MKAVCIIPARYGSTRLPGKPLALLGDKPMIRWVYEHAVKANAFSRILIATDDERIRKTCSDFGAEVVMTDPMLPSGTDRVARVVRDLSCEVVVNLQGDEPFVKPQLLDQLVAAFNDPEVQIATPIKKISNYKDITEPNLVRVVKDRNNYALYFSRAAIPHIRDEADVKKWLTQHTFYKHVGIYAYRRETLLQLTTLPQSSLEKAERLEQLRFLENGFRIFTVETDYESVSVDTEEDLRRVNELINQFLGKY